MLRITFNGETIGDDAEAAMTLQTPVKMQASGSGEVVELVAGDFLEAFARGNKGLTLSFTVMHQYGSVAAATIALASRDRDMVQQGPLYYIVDDGSTVTTLLMKDALRRPVDGEQMGVCVRWNYTFTGAKFAEVQSADTVADYAGGLADSGDTFTGFYWGGACGDGTPGTGNWQRELVGEEI